MTISRRNLLTSVAVSAAVAKGLGSTRGAWAQASVSSNTPYAVRKDINTLADNDPIVESYRDAVGQMRALPVSDALSWEHQASIHLNYCPHGNWYFLPWHRAYLHQLEDIVRKLSGYEQFALPYWDWARNPQIPSVFWGDGNPLNHPRTADQNTSMPAEFVGPQVINDIMEETGFEPFASYKSSAPYNGMGGGYGDLEGTPHNRVHGVVGGDMATFLSPLDPIFWLHHCNIDRIWASWNAAGNANTTDTDLSDFVFMAAQADRGGNVNASQFVDRDGNAKDYKVADMYATSQMGYAYDRLEDAAETSFVVASRELAERSVSSEVVEQALVRTAAAGVPLSTNLVLSSAQTDAVAEAGRAKQLSRVRNVEAAAPPSIATARLIVSGLKPPKNPESVIRVFLNCDYLTLDTPIYDPHYVTSAAFFLAGGHQDTEAAHSGDGLTFVFDLTETVDALRRSGRDPRGNLMPQIIAIGPDGSGSELEIDGKFEINVETVG